MLKSRFNLADSKAKEDTEDDLDEDREEKTEDPKDQAEEDEQHAYEQLGEGVTEEEEKKPVFAERRLHRAEVSVRLSLLGLTAEGDGYTYLKAVCTGMSLTNISAIQYFKHLQFLDVSNNNLESAALQIVGELPFLVLIHADKNVLTTANLKKMKYLQVIIMNNNNITSVHEVYQSELRTLEVGYNKIRRLFFVYKMQSITCLDFRYNFIKDISELDFPNLDSLYLAGNKIVSLVGLEQLVNLRILHVRYNPIKLLDGFEDSHKKLQYINLRNCKVATLRQIKKLRVLPALETLIMKGCPYMGGTGEENAEGGQEEDDAEIRIEMLAALPRLKRINKGVITPEERIEAKELMAQWLEEGEKDEEEIEDEHIEGEPNVDE